MSVSGIGESTLADVDAFCAEMDARSVPVSLLVAPRMRDDYRLDRDPRTVDWLTGRRAAGDALVLHGYDEAATKRRRGEFAMLRAHEANLRLMAADRVLEHLGLRTRLFAAPGWLVSPGVRTALPANGFRLLADLHGITDLVRLTTVRARVLGIGEGFLAEPWWCRMVVMSAERIARRGGVVRIAVAAPSFAQVRSAAGDARCRRPGDAAGVHTDGVPVASRCGGTRRGLTERLIGGVNLYRHERCCSRFRCRGAHR
ncbi:putative deacetylase [Mycobacterium tuberculosis]|nr:putative deacetylase [Mycobacterium tuberculosis]